MQAAVGRGADETRVALAPFVLPWDDASPGVTNVSGWLAQAAGKFGPVHAGTDGHLYAGEQRMRFFGVNLCFDATMPRKEGRGQDCRAHGKIRQSMSCAFITWTCSPFPPESAPATARAPALSIRKRSTGWIT